MGTCTLHPLSESRVPGDSSHKRQEGKRAYPLAFEAPCGRTLSDLQHARCELTQGDPFALEAPYGRTMRLPPPQQAGPFALEAPRGRAARE